MPKTSNHCFSLRSHLEECLRREAERVAHQENLMNQVVYDSVDSAPKNFMGGELPDNDKSDEAFKGED